jgi:hypothetical protein
MKNVIFPRILDNYEKGIKDETFNGIKLQEINQGVADAALNSIILELVIERKIDIISSETQLNPHIKRHPPQPVDVQLKYFNILEKYHTCLYPTQETIATNLHLEFLDPRPFTKEIARGHHELKPIFFEIGALDRYRLDPRYHFNFSEYAGRISMSSETETSGPIPKRDQISIQTFGLGIDEDDNAVVCVFLRYLSQLSSEHQRHWESFVSVRPAKMHINYYKSSYLGNVFENNSAIATIRIAINSINEVCEKVWGARLFVNSVPSDIHYNLSPFMRASESDYLIFVHELDKLISENINLKFFDGKVDPYTLVPHSDGLVERKLKGTLTLLDEWLFEGDIHWRDAKTARREVMQPFRKLRRERQKPAHVTSQNKFSPKRTNERREILGSTAFALANIMRMLMKHPQSPIIKIPQWLQEGRIEVI